MSDTPFLALLKIQCIDKTPFLGGGSVESLLSRLSQEPTGEAAHGSLESEATEKCSPLRQFAYPSGSKK